MIGPGPIRRRGSGLRSSSAQAGWSNGVKGGNARGSAEDGESCNADAEEVVMKEFYVYRVLVESIQKSDLTASSGAINGALA